jgi:serine/threonine-protein kinase
VTDEQWPAGLERFLARALQREREQRFATALEALEEWRAIQPVHMPSRPAPPPRPTGPGEDSDADDAKTTVDGPPTMTEASFSAEWDDDGARTQLDDELEPSD